MLILLRFIRISSHRLMRAVGARALKWWPLLRQRIYFFPIATQLGWILDPASSFRQLKNSGRQILFLG